MNTSSNPIVLGIAGAYSGSGKTTVACHILKALDKWGAIKYTHKLFGSSIITDLDLLDSEGKDTQRLLSAGAEKVLWIRSSRKLLGRQLEKAKSLLSGQEGIIVEGNSAVKMLRPDFIVFVARGNKIKPSAREVMAMADMIVYEYAPPAYAPPDKPALRINNGAFVSEVMRMIRDQSISA